MAYDGDKRLLEIPEATSIESDDFLYLDGATEGTRKLPTSMIPDLIPDATDTQKGLMSAADKDKLDNLAEVAESGSYTDLIDKPTASDISVDPTGMEIITANNTQGALKQLDTAVDEVRANSLKAQQVQFSLASTVTIPANSNGVVLNRLDISTSTQTDAVFTNKQLKELFGGHTILGVVGLWCTGGAIPQETIVWAGTNEVTVGFRNNNSTALTVNAVRILVLYS